MLVGGGDAKTTKQYFTQLPASVIPRRMEDTDSYTQGHSQPTVCVSRSVMSNSWTVASQAPLSMKISRPEYWSRQPYSSPRDLPNPGIKSRSPTLWADSLPSEPPEYYKAHKFKFSKAFKIQEFNSVYTFSWFSPLPMHHAFNLNIRLPTCLITHNCDKSINQRQYST